MDGPTVRLSAERVVQAYEVMDPIFRDSPQYLSESLSSLLGLRLWVKNETFNPLKSFKGRGADFYVSQLPSAQALVCASAGNFGQALAYAARKRGVPLTVYAARTANPAKVAAMRGFGATVLLHGDDFDAAKVEARRVADEAGSLFVEDGREAAITEGAGTIGLELLRAGTHFDTIFLPLGNGALINGVALWTKTHAPDTKIIGVCAEGAPAMKLSFESHAVHATDSVATIADGIAVRVPVPEALGDMQGLVDNVVTVTDAQLMQAMRLALEHTGVLLEPAGAAGLAGIIACQEKWHSDAVATVFCGANIHSSLVSKVLAG